MKYAIITYGCQMNLSDSERIATILDNLQYKKAKTEQDADLIIFNMCSVRQSATDRVFGKIKNLRNKQVLITGCILEKDKKIIKEKNITVFDIKDLEDLPSLIDPKHYKTQGSQNYFNIPPSYSNKYTAYIPIMTGCNNFCSYCIVPYTRGKEISRPATEIFNEITNLITKGYKRIFLLGQNVNSYQDNNIDFSKLLKKINTLSGDFWITFTSSHPKDLSDKLIQTIAKYKKVCPYINLPIQSGSNEILKKMNRHYTREDYLFLIEKIRQNIPDICISTDIIVGFPGETKKQLTDTAKIFRKVKYDMAFINKYSRRPQTAAFQLKDNISKEEKENRAEILTEILKKTALANNKKMIGKTIEVLVEKQDAKGNLFGSTKNMKHIKIINSNKKEFLGKIIKAKITKATAWHLEGIFI